MKYFLIAGEPSGDMHAAKLMEEIKLADRNAVFEFFGGDLMNAQGGVMHLHYSKMAFMGLWGVLSNINTIRKNFKTCEKAVLAFNPDLLIFIDYPGFNLRMAKFAKHHNIKTAYYISPKIWAWKTKRVHQVKAYVDQMYTIFPFETAFYQNYNYPVNYVGNPVFDIIQKELSADFNIKDFCELNSLSQKPIIALLAGSRTEEIKLTLPVMAQVADYFPEYQFVIAGAPNQAIGFYTSVLNNNIIPVVFNQTYALLRASKAAIVTSGTATLETALLNIPQLVVYKMGMGWLMERIKSLILKTDYFSLVNLVAEREVVKELFQSQVSLKNLKNELENILNNEQYRLKMLNSYHEIGIRLNSNGAAKKAATAMVKSIIQ